MITCNKLYIYSRYNGNVDMWTRTGRDSEEFISAEWQLIDSLIQDYVIIDNHNASFVYIDEFNKKLTEHFDSNEAIALFKSIAKKTVDTNH